MKRRQYRKEQLAYFHHLAYSLPIDEVADGLQDTVQKMIRAGRPPESLYEELKLLALELRSEGRDDLEDEVMEVMDVLVGWCAPSARL